MYINVFEKSNMKLPFHIIQGARGCGKTFSCLAGAAGLTPEIYKPSGKFMLIRRLDDDCETIAADKSGELNPFLKINRKYGSEISLKKMGKHLWGFYEDYDCKGRVLGYMTALTTIGKVRGGGSFDSVTIAIGDEFNPESHIRRIPNEGKAWLSAYESICRNRESEGEEPLQMFWLSNSDDFNNALCSYLGIINDIERMVNKHGYGKVTFPKRKLEYSLLETDHEFLEFKVHSAIGALAQGTDYAEMAFYNKFAYNDFSLIEHKSIKQSHPLFAVDNVYIWQHNNGNYYACYAKGDVIDHYNSKNIHDRIAIFRNWKFEFTQSFMRGRFFFETYEIKQLLIDILVNGGIGGKTK